MPSPANNVTRPSKTVLWLQQNAGKALAIAFALYVSALATVLYAPTPVWLTAARGFAIEHLGQLGDSFGPLTAIFAAIAALGAWRSYATQREQLEHERARAEQEKVRHQERLERDREQLEAEKRRYRGTRFDETFFRLIEYYGREIDELSLDLPKETYVLRPGLRERRDAITAFKTSVKLYNSFDTPGSILKAFNWGFERKHFKPLLLLRDQEIAITRWLERQSEGVAVIFRGALLVAKLSDNELWFWYFAIQSTEDEKLIDFASRLGINQKRAMDAENKPDPPPENDPNAGHASIQT